jgi:hypothetical protein
MLEENLNFYYLVGIIYPMMVEKTDYLAEDSSVASKSDAESAILNINNY